MLPAIGRVIEAIRRIYPGAHEVLCQLLAKAAVGSDRLMVSVEASTGTGTARSWMTGRAQSRITGVVAAQAALETLAVPIPEIGRASCRGRVCTYVYISVVAVRLKKKHKMQITSNISTLLT